MLSNAMRLPWTQKTVPHGLIDILRGCNISCENCYNDKVKVVKSYDQVVGEIDTMIKLRKVHSIALIGGEPLLHPNLMEIIKYISNRGIYVEIFTNGVLLTKEILDQFKKFGVSVVFIHVEKTQTRPDLPKDATEEDARFLRKTLAKLIVDSGVECGMSITSYKDRLESVTDVINDCINIKEITYLLVTLYRDFKRFENICGEVNTGFCGNFTKDHNAEDTDYTTHDVLPYLKEKLSLNPFAYIGSNKDKNEARWVSYLIANFYPKGNESSPISYSLSSSKLEKLFLKYYYLIKRRYPFYQEQDSKKLMSQIKLNGKMGGNKTGNTDFINKIKNQEGELNALRVLVQNPAELDGDGSLRYCENCPDAVIKDGKLVPVCISDRVC